LTSIVWLTGSSAGSSLIQDSPDCILVVEIDQGFQVSRSPLNVDLGARAPGKHGRQQFGNELAECLVLVALATLERSQNVVVEI
jgi:hypothetical protein